MKRPDNSLLKKNCIPCKGKVSYLLPDIASNLLRELGNDWIINESKKLYKEYKFNNFIAVIEFVNKIAKIAEEEGHHPDLFISWGKCIVSVWTHEINGLTENDFILAAKIENINR
jgi:4a-hydroxytetrahydrobiopterin dehydratase